MESDLQIIEEHHATPNDELHGYFRAEARDDGVLAITGWALGRTSEVSRVEVRSNGDMVASSELDVERLDIAVAFASRSDALRSGFEISMEAQGAGESHLVIEAELQDGKVTPLGEIRVKAPRRIWTRLLGRN